MPFIFILVFLMFFFQSHPIFFLQNRVGMNGIEFKIYKFRTMAVNSEDEYALTKGKNDIRITKIGHFLRKYKLDEIPQLYNILIGDMSIVGPRPQVISYTKKYNQMYQDLLKTRPGMLSYSALKYVNEDELLATKENIVSYYENVILPDKYELDKQLYTEKSIKIYFSVVFLYISKLLLNK
jgi:lipopolysaccharide/colanic/teichoic acid biosynthesis glycosyltransferase